MNETANRNARVIAFYLPQFHPIPENDEWWGKGFTEWTNVGKAKPQFKGHYQPRVPADLGYYDLRLPEAREAQTELAKYAGVESFMYWHYWFGNGRRILERPFDEVLKSGKPDFPFCLGWANHSWSNHTWISEKQWDHQILIEQTYPGVEDYTAHFYHVLNAFKDKRYTKVNGKPLFLVYSPLDLPSPKLFLDTWTDLAIQNGLDGIYFVGLTHHLKDHQIILDSGFDGINSLGYIAAERIVMGRFWRKARELIQRHFGLAIHRTEYKDMIKYIFNENDKLNNVFPSILPQWDRTPRAGKYADMFINSSPELFKEHINDALNIISDKPFEQKILFLRAWNEWGDGNYVEPDLKFGTQYLQALKETILK